MRGLLSVPGAADSDGVSRLEGAGGDVWPLDIGGDDVRLAAEVLLPAGDLGDIVVGLPDTGSKTCCSTDLRLPPARKPCV